MAWPLILAGMALQAVGGLMANQSQADRESQNADFLRAQAEFAQASGDREKKIAINQFAQEQGMRITSFAGGNIDLSSTSAVNILAGQSKSNLEQLSAIDYKTAMDVRLATERANQSADTSRMLRDPMYNLLSIGGPLLSTAAGGVNAFKTSSDRNSSSTSSPEVNSSGSFVGSGSNNSFYGSNYLSYERSIVSTPSYLGTYKF